jgi:CHAT domain-containing protein
MSSMRSVYLVIALMLISNLAVAREYINARNNDCLLWNPNPTPNEEVDWLGSCSDGYADGFGEARWFKSGSPSNRVIGTFLRGRSIGEVHVVYPNASQYTGFLSPEKGGPNGRGVFKDAYGFIYDGKFNETERRADVLLIAPNNSIKPIVLENWIFKNIKDIIDAAKKASSKVDHEELLLEAISIAEATFGTFHFQTTIPLIELVSFYEDNLQFKKAIFYNETLIDIARRTDDLNGQLIGFYLGARLYANVSEYNKSIEYYKNFIQLCDEKNAKYWNYGSSLVRLGWLYFVVGSNDEALKYFHLAIQNSKLTAAEQPIDYIESLSAYAMYLRYNGKKETAIKVLKENLEFWVKGSFVKEYDKNLLYSHELYMALAEAYVDQSSFAEASLILNEYNNLRALSTPVKDTAYENVDMEVELIQASILLKQKQYHDVERLVNSVLKKVTNIHLNSWRYSDLQNIFAIALFEQGKYNEALIANAKAYDMLITIAPSNHRKLARTMFWRAKINYGMGNLNNAIDNIFEYKKIVQETEELFIEIFYEASIKGVISDKFAFDNSFELIQRSVGSEISRAAEVLAERIFSGNPRMSATIAALQENKRSLIALNNIFSEEVTKVKSEQRAELISQTSKLINEKTRELEKNQEKINSEKGSSASNNVEKILNSAQANNFIDDRAAIIYFYFGEQDDLYSWLIIDGKNKFGRIKYNRKELENNIAAIRKSIDFANSHKFNFEASLNVYNTLFSQFSEDIIGIKKLYIIDSKYLSSLPLQILIDRPFSGDRYSEAPWMFKKYAIINVPSLGLFKAKKNFTSHANASSILAIGDPIVGGSKRVAQNVNRGGGQLDYTNILYNRGNLNIDALYNVLTPLPNSRKEIGLLSKKFPEAKIDILVGKDATKENFINRNLALYNIIYFSTHGLIAGDLLRYADDGAEPALVLSRGANSENRRDGLLFASEISGLSLSADWVILSACNTGASRDYNGEPLSGLATAFFLAGAQSLLVSHWEISDRATAQILPRMFDAEVQKKTKGEKLQYAIMRYFEETSANRYLHPKYWAPFMVIGD